MTYKKSTIREGGLESEKAEMETCQILFLSKF